MCCCFKQSPQERGKSVDELPSSESSFSSLLKNAYQKGVAVLLEEGVKEKLNEAIPELQPQLLVLGSKQVLLYLKTTVENFGSVSHFLPLHPFLANLYLVLEKVVRRTEAGISLSVYRSLQATLYLSSIVLP